MRLLLGILTLLTLFSAAAIWQRSWTTEARAGREGFPSSAREPDSPAVAEGWSRVVLGRPSGGELYEGRVDSGLAGSATEQGEAHAVGQVHATRRDSRETELPSPAPGPTPAPTQPAKDTVITVQAGQTLSEICLQRYGSARRELVLALARYNRMERPDDMREGQEILLPALESLREPR
ncbi:MAG: hypothetical protein ACKVXR_11160 [Planctomycetota bacterium]